jgi:hypothetical protein
MFKAKSFLRRCRSADCSIHVLFTAFPFHLKGFRFVILLAVQRKGYTKIFNPSNYFITFTKYNFTFLKFYNFYYLVVNT